MIRILLLSMFVIGASVAYADDTTARNENERVFTLKVLPLLKEKCFQCHGGRPEDIKGEYDLTSREGLLKGGESGEAAVIAGQPAESPLMAAVRWDSLEMPPKENDRLTPIQIEVLQQWIQAGATWPNDESQAHYLQEERNRWETDEGVLVKTSGGLSDAWTWRRYDPANLWAYQPLWNDPDGMLKEGSRNAIDILIERQQSELGLTPAPLADRLTLLRRATFDLTGLPPTPQEIGEYLEDPAEDLTAFARLVDRLLASPHYGERWGQHWLDVVRYADSAGFANDYERGNAWRYRDYVVRSLNSDKPYDQFVREQLAGDEILEEWQVAHPDDEITPEESELLIAVGFLRMGPWELTGMEVARIARQRFLDDVTDMVGEVFLGHMLQCARCHDHKFDPVPTRDYYSIQAAFATTQIAERSAAFLRQENLTGFEERKYLEQRDAYYDQMLAELDAKQTLDAARAWFKSEGQDASEFEVAVEKLTKSDPPHLDEVRKEMQRRKVAPEQIPPRHVGFEPRDFGMERIARKGKERLKWRLDRYEPLALSVYDGRTPELKSVNNSLRMPADRMQVGILEETCILTGGDPFSPGQPVKPGTLSAVAFGEPAPAVQPGVSGRRLALANWIVSPENPLTARVMANRIWQGHFGQALAGNPNNFGATGKKPSHPELLDWLAGRLRANGWSMKALHREVMLSETYRRASQHPQPDTLKERDPLHTSYAVFEPRRLSAEELRDAMLAASGELNRDLGGIPIRPEMNLEAALQPRMVMGTFAEAWQPSPLPGQRHRRSLYALRIRGQRDPFQEIFNAPSPDLSCEARSGSTVTPQVFALFNSEITYDRALALANRCITDVEPRDRAAPPDDEGVLQRMYLLILNRVPDSTELAQSQQHWHAMTQRHCGIEFASPSYPREVVREAVEENTGERFTFREPLEVYTDFVPDLKPYQVSPRTRGLAEVALVLFNSNEFAYVY